MNALRLYQNAYKTKPLVTHAIETGKTEGHFQTLNHYAVACGLESCHWSVYLADYTCYTIANNFPCINSFYSPGIIMTSADVISQLVVEKKSLNSVDIARSLRFGVIGLCIVVGVTFPSYSCFSLSVCLTAVCFHVSGTW